MTLRRWEKTRLSGSLTGDGPVLEFVPVAHDGTENQSTFYLWGWTHLDIVLTSTVVRVVTRQERRSRRSVTRTDGVKWTPSVRTCKDR